MAVFGGKYGNLEFNSIISIIKDIINRNYTSRKHSLELRKMEAEVKTAEQEALAKELENIEKIQRLQLSQVDTLVKPLSEAAEHLRIKPNDSTFIDLRDYLKKREDQTEGQ